MRYFILFILFFPLFIFSEIIFDFEKGVENWQCFSANTKISQSDKYSYSGDYSLCLNVKNASEVIIGTNGNFDFSNYSLLYFTTYLPESAQTEADIVFYVKDDEYHWFETKRFEVLRGEERKIKINLKADGFKSVAHLKKWDSYTEQSLIELGIIIKFHLPYTGVIYFDDFEGVPDNKSFYIYNLRTNSDRIEKYNKFEITFQLSYISKNPFNPDLEIKGIFFSPDGRKFFESAFFYQDYLRSLEEDGENIYSYGRGEWKIRFTPSVKGEYRYGIEIEMEGKKKYYECGKFFVYAGKDRGFLKWDEKDNYYLSFSNGKFFYPVGHTIRSPDDIRSPYPYEFTYKRNQGTFAYDKYFKKMSENGENYIRMWTTAWWLGVEWSRSYSPYYKNLGKYNLKNAWQLDYIFDIAKKYGIYIDLTLINHGQFSIRPDAEWWDNPYNKINGGFLSSPDEFFVNKKAIDYFKRRLDYIVSRWSYSTNITFWELWNEIDLTGYYDTDKVRYWHKIIVPYLKEIDNYRHPISTHYCRRNEDPLVWIIPQLSSLTGNSYHSEIVSSMETFYKKRKPFEKPIFVNEFGVGKNRYFLENNLHGGIWSSSMLPMSGVALFWWWPFIDHYNLYFHYRALSSFWKGEDRRNKNLQMSDAKIFGKDAGIVGIQNDCEGFFWVFDEGVFNKKIKREKFVEMKNVRVEIKHLKNGIYKCQFWDTYKGDILKEDEIVVKNNRLEIEVPVFYGDIALKIKKEK